MSYFCIIQRPNGFRYVGDSREMGKGDRIVGQVVNVITKHSHYYQPARVESSLDYQVGKDR